MAQWRLVKAFVAVTACLFAGAGHAAFLAGASGGRQSPGDTLLTPLPNDTIPESYYAKVDQAIAEAQLTTPSPLTALGISTEKAALPYQSIAGASRTETVTAQDLTKEELANAEIAGVVQPPTSAGMAAATISKRVNVVPYDMELGARLMYTLTEKQQSTSTPIPEQSVINEQFVAQCPMVMFANSIAVAAPRCGQPMGQWIDPTTARTVLRWAGKNDGGITLGVDSLVGGNGSVLFANLAQQIKLSGNTFEVSNCLGVKRWTIEEQITKIDNIGEGVTSSIQAHDATHTGVAFFYKYTLVAPNGTTMAESSLFRMGQNEVNITMLNTAEANGPLVATATRMGTWTGDQWRTCGGPTRAWQVDFKLSSREFDSVATVQDLRVATAALVTFMAFRAETIDVKTGVNNSGETNMAKNLLVALFWVLIGLFVFACLLTLIRNRGWDVKSRRLCFRIEKICMPKTPAWSRQPVFRPTY